MPNYRMTIVVAATVLAMSGAGTFSPPPVALVAAVDNPNPAPPPGDAYPSPVIGPCPSCNGTGDQQVGKTNATGGTVPVTIPCKGCKGQGKVYG